MNGLREDLGSRLGAEVLDRLQAIDAYDLSFVADRWVEKTGGLIGPADVELAARELKRFFALSVIFPDEMLFPPTRIDAAWHEFILFTPQYRRFCADVVGKPLDHNPRPPLDPRQQGPLRTLEMYTEAFAPAPAYMWGPVSRAEQRRLLYRHSFADLRTSKNTMLLVGLLASLTVAILAWRHRGPVQPSRWRR